MKFKYLLVSLLLTGCNDSNKNTVKPIDVPQKLASDFAPISPLYAAPYTVTETEYVEDPKSINIVDANRGYLSCIGECELPITGYAPSNRGSVLFSIDNSTILTL